MSRRYLVFVRAGSQSLHRTWLVEDPLRNWDCWVSWYCSSEDRLASAAEYSSNQGGNKLEGFTQGCSAQNVDLSGYRYIALLDDDIEFSPGDISRAFVLCDHYQIDLAQPSLRLGSNVNHHVTLSNPLCEVRRVSFVEVMMPFFRLDTLLELRDTFGLAKSTWGIDYAWSSRLAHRSGARGKIAILDAIRAHHTKPFDTKGGAFYRWLSSQGVDAEEEYSRIKSAYPSFGGLKTLSEAHILIRGLRWLPTWLAIPIVRLAESIKKRVHRYRIAAGGNS